MTSPGSPSHKARPIVAGELTFPCWLWAVKGVHAGHWIKHRDFPWEPDHFTHWHPDQLEAPTERPDDLPTTECLQGQPGDVCQHKFCQPTEIPSSSRPANEGGEHQILGTGFYRDAEPGTFGQSEWLDLLMACQDGRATCMRVLEIIEREFALKSVAADEALLAKMTDAFLKWKLPKSVRSDPCATMNEAQYPHPRYGTNLLSLPETMQMFQEVVCPIIAEYLKAHPQQPSAGQGELGELLAWALSRGNLKHYHASTNYDYPQTAQWHCTGCDGVFTSHWPKWEEPTDATFPHKPDCKYIKAVTLLSGPIPPPPPATPVLDRFMEQPGELPHKVVVSAEATGEPTAKEGETQSDYPTVVANWHAENASLRERLHAAKAELARAKSGGGEWCRIANDALTENETLKARLAQLEAAADAGKKDSQAWSKALADAGDAALAEARYYREMIEWLHTGSEKDPEGYEWGIYRVKLNEHGQPISVLHTLTDLSDLRAEMVREKDAKVLTAMSPSPAAGTEKEKP